MHDSSSGHSPASTPEQYLNALGAQLQKQEGRVLIRASGQVELNDKTLTWAVVPAKGVLAKTGKWRKLTSDEQLALVQERIDPAVVEALHRQITAFVLGFIRRASQLGEEPWDYLAALADAANSDPVEFLFQAIDQRLNYATEKAREARHEEATRESIKLSQYPASFELAWNMPRRFIALLGPTNSGKSHEAVQALAEAQSGVYLAPLRLLALENYERLSEQLALVGKKVNLVTGEERREQEGATHVASTVEMLDTRRAVQVAVIDEIQMLADRERGAAWTAAVCGAPAPLVYLVGAPEARSAVEALARRLNVPIEIKMRERMAPLSMEAAPVRRIQRLQKGDAVIAFSRREVLMWRDMVTEAGFSCATVYGNLSPEVRQAQAARFREEQADIVVGTDAIAMGLNLPIRRVVFTTANKFNGVEEEELPTALARQIAGRAGRYGLHEEGHVAGFDDNTHEVVRSLLREKLPPLPTRGFAVAPSMEHLSAIARITGEQSLAQALRRFMRNIDTADAFFRPRITEEQQERAQWLDRLALSLEDKFILSLVPISSRVPVLNDAWQHWARGWAKRQASRLPAPRARETLQEAEDYCRLCSAYAWLAYRAPAFFPDIEEALEEMRQASERVDRMLAAHNRARQQGGLKRSQRRRPR